MRAAVVSNNSRRLLVAHALPSAQVLQPSIDCNLPQPPSKRARRVELAQLAPGLQKTVLRQVIGEGGVAAEAAKQRADLCVAAPHEFRECWLVTIACECHDHVLGSRSQLRCRQGRG